ncbi:TPA: helix-turn-helix domain-containing protein, partial [Escherichia coli]|nr:helix-turn-helix domain-containing protein [Escherichia coli]
KELLLWIEVNLEKPLLLDDVAIRSGYTKWHLQRVFKQATGLTLASYIRGRRLTKAATELRLTKLPILTVALRYQFDSQQSFTRRFKATFGVTPTEYRKLDNLCGNNFQPPINFDVVDLPIPKIMELPESYVYGMQYQYFCSIEDIGKLHEDIRHQFWNDFLLYTDKNFIESTVLISYQPNTLRKNKIQIDYEIGLNSLDHFTKTSGFRKRVIEAGRYVRFQFKGTLEEYKQFAMKIYFYTLPALGLCRRLGADIERYVSIETNIDLMELPKTLEIDYFVPIH